MYAQAMVSKVDIAKVCPIFHTLGRQASSPTGVVRVRATRLRLAVEVSTSKLEVTPKSVVSQENASSKLNLAV